MKANHSGSSEINKIIQTLANVLANETFSQLSISQLLAEFKALLPKGKGGKAGWVMGSCDPVLECFTNVLAQAENFRLVVFNPIQRAINHLKTLDTNFVSNINVLSANIKAYTLKAKSSFKQMSNNLTESIEEQYAMKNLFEKITEAYEGSKSKSISNSGKMIKEKVRLFNEHHDFLIDQSHQLASIIKYSDNLSINFFNEAKNTFKSIKTLHKGQIDSAGANTSCKAEAKLNPSQLSRSVPMKRQKSRASPFFRHLQCNMMIDNTALINNSCYTNIATDLSSVNNTCTNHFNSHSLHNEHNFTTFNSLSMKNSHQNSLLLLKSDAKSSNKRSASMNKPKSSTSSISINYSPNISVKEYSELILEFIRKMKLLQEAICNKDKNVLLFKKNFEVQKRAIIKLSSSLVKNPLSKEGVKQIAELEADIKGYKEEINALKEQKSQMRIVQNQLRELNSENDSLKQANEGLIAQCNEMRAHIKKAEASNEMTLKYKREFIQLSVKLKKLHQRKEEASPLSITASTNPMNHDIDETDLTSSMSYSIEELKKGNEAILTQLLNVQMNNGNNGDNNSNNGSKTENKRMKSTLVEIVMALNDVIRTYSLEEELESTFNIIAGSNNPINLLESSNRTLSKKSNQSLSIPIIDQDIILSQIEKVKKILNDYCNKLKRLSSELNKKNSLRKSQLIYNEESNCCDRTFTVEDLMNPQTGTRESIEEDILKIKNELISQLVMKDQDIQRLNERICQVTSDYCNEDDQSANVMRMLSEEKEKNNEMKKTYLKTLSELMCKVESVHEKKVNDDKLRELLKVIANEYKCNPKLIEYVEMIKKICFEPCVDNKKEEENGKKKEKMFH